MQMPFQGSFYNQAVHPPNHFQWRPNFTPRGTYPRPPRPHWRPPPDEYSNEHWCETCDRGFRTVDILEKHKQQHQKCNIDGCQFIAHPKVITKHIQMQHASGLYKKIAKLQDPEEIKKWRDERKKKYPTKENVEKAAAAIKEKIDRGEKMGLKSDRHERNPKTGIGSKRKPYDGQRNHTPRFNQNAPNKRKKLIPKPNDKKLPAVEDTRKLKPFGGIQELYLDADEHQEVPECSFTIEDDEDLSEETTPLPETVISVSGSVCLALSSLQCNYGSSDEEECEKDQIVTQKLDKHEIPIKNDIHDKLIPQTKHESDDDSGPEEVKVTKEIINEPNNAESKPETNKRKYKNEIPKKTVFKRPKPKLPSTLLHKLLFKEMRHERNIVLQCIRHIVRNNFFDKTG